MLWLARMGHQRAVPNQLSKGRYPSRIAPEHAIFRSPGAHRRAAVASIVSSSRFLVREDAVWGGSVSAGTDLSSIDWDAGRGVVAVGTRDGAIGTSLTPDPWCCDVRDEHGGFEAARGVDWGWTSTSGLNTQVWPACSGMETLEMECCGMNAESTVPENSMPTPWNVPPRLRHSTNVL